MASGLRVLIVDDSELARDYAIKLVSTSLQSVDIAVAADGPEAIEMMKKADFDIVFCDIILPSMSGLQVIVALNELANTSDFNVPFIVFISTGASAEAYLIADKLGVVEFLHKPYNQAAIDNLIGIYYKRLSPMRVLVVDDSQTVRRLVQRIIEASKFNLVFDEVGSGSEALEKISSVDYDAIFLDINMPEMNGITALRKIRDMQPKLGVALMSSDHFNEVQARYSGFKIDYYLKKPFTASELDGVLYGLFNLKKPKLHSRAIALRDALAL